MSSDEVIGRDLVRLRHNTRGGVEIIHTATCGLAQSDDRVPWDWGNGRPVSEWPDWFRPCKRCRPDREHARKKAKP